MHPDTNASLFFTPQGYFGREAFPHETGRCEAAVPCLHQQVGEKRETGQGEETEASANYACNFRATLLVPTMKQCKHESNLSCRGLLLLEKFECRTSSVLFRLPICLAIGTHLHRETVRMISLVAAAVVCFVVENG